MGLFQKHKQLTGTKTNLPSLDVQRFDLSKTFTAGKGGKLPNASLIYGISSAALLSFSLYHLFEGAWVTAFLLFFVSGVLFAFALYFLRYQEH